MSSKIHPRADPPWPTMRSIRSSRIFRTFKREQAQNLKSLRSRGVPKPCCSRCIASDCCVSFHSDSNPTTNSDIVSPFVLATKDGDQTRSIWIFGSVRDPNTEAIKKLNRVFLLAFTLGMFVDPLFLVTLTIDDKMSCLYVDQRYVSMVTAMRAMVDVMYLWHMWLQLKLAYFSKESLVPGRGELVWDARDVALHYLCRLRGFFFDLYVILPIPQIMLWVVVPHIVNLNGKVTEIMTYMLVAFLIQYIPKGFHLLLILRRMRRVTGYVFGTAWWGFALNLICYLLASHAFGTCWYLLGVQRVERCVEGQCYGSCRIAFVGCTLPIANPNSQPANDANLAWGQGNVSQLCFDSKSDYPWGIYAWAIPLTKSATNGVEKFMFPLFWGIMTVSSFGNALTPSNNLVEATFCVLIITSGLLLFTMLIGNIQVFLHSHTSKMQAMQLKMREIEWCMKRRQLPPSVRQRVRQSEREKWSATRGVEETQLISELPEGLRRDIKRHLCVDLVRRVPLFDDMDDLVIDNICDRLKPLELFVGGETIVDEGDPVLRMVFVARGYIQSTYRLLNGSTSTLVMGPGNFAGDELIGWCFGKQRAHGGLPPSTATLTTLGDVELFGLDAEDLRYITRQFRHKFDKVKLRNTARYWSSNWRTWAAVTIQLAWRRFKQQRDIKRESAKSSPLSGVPSGPPSSPAKSSPLTTGTPKETLRLYTAMLCSPKPPDISFRMD